MEDIVAQVKMSTADSSDLAIQRWNRLRAFQPDRAVDELNLITRKTPGVSGREQVGVYDMKQRASRLEDVVTVLH